MKIKRSKTPVEDLFSTLYIDTVINLKKYSFLILIVCGIIFSGCDSNMQTKNKLNNQVPAEQVLLDSSSILGKRLLVNANTTLWHNLKMLEKYGYFDNFRLAAGLTQGEYRGNIHGYADSEVYKFIEGASYIYSSNHNPEILTSLDSIIDLIRKAQRPNGHLHTLDASKGKDTIFADNAWSSHRMYDAGHLYEGAVAHFNATGQESLLNIAIKNADMMCEIFSDSTRTAITSGHPEIETGLLKLYRLTNDQDYYLLAKKLIDFRGNKTDKGQGLYDQKHLPVLEQKEAVGHAVRAIYLYTGITDLALETENQEYKNMLDSVWNNMVTKKTYISGGVGSYHRILENGKERTWEGFGGNYELPNDCYCESCAAIANAIWNYRMFLLNPHGKYIDMLERIIFNNALAMSSLDGDSFYYQNELTSSLDIQNNRKEWVDCCTNSILRYFPQIPGWMYAKSENTLYVNLYGQSEASLNLENNKVKLIQNTDYPWDGKIKLFIKPENPQNFKLKLRIPEWAMNRPMYGDLYRFLKFNTDKPALNLNDEDIPFDIADGYITLERVWANGDSILLTLPMPVRRVLSNYEVENNRLKVALQRGPVVYCAESPDNNNHTHDLILPDSTKFTFYYDESLLSGTYVIEGFVDDVSGQTRKMKAIPYYSWGYRGNTEMDVWLKRVIYY